MDQSSCGNHSPIISALYSSLLHSIPHPMPFSQEEKGISSLPSPFGRGAGVRGWRGKGFRRRYLPCLPLDLRYLKNSELGSSTSTSFRPRKLAL